MDTKIKKRTYVKPAMQVYELPSTPKILACSDGTPGSRNPYGNPIPYNWD